MSWNRGWVELVVLASFGCSPLFAQNGATSALPNRRFPFDATASPLATSGVEVVPDALRMRELAEFDAVRLDGVPWPDGTTIEIELERLHFERFDFGIHLNGRQSLEWIDRSDLTLWRGQVAGEPDSDVFLGLSEYGTRGWIRRGERGAHLIALPSDAGWDRSILRIVDQAAVGAREDTVDGYCSTVTRLPSSQTGGQKSATSAAAGIIEARIAVDCDFQLFQKFSSAAAESTYVLTLLAAVSSRYESQIGIALTYPYLNFWTNSNDPYVTQDSGGSTLALLTEFTNKWKGNIPAGAHLGHLLSGADLGGGIAYVDVLCNSQYSFGVSANLHGLTSFPITPSPLNWDFVVVAHEIGHNFSAKHTHDECPPLDQCAPAQYYGLCQSQQVCSNQGTIMSYCQLCPGGVQNITTYFHPKHVNDIRQAALDSCLVEGCSSKELNFANGPANTGLLSVAGSPIPGYSVGMTIQGMPTSASTGLLLLSSGFGTVKTMGGTIYPSVIGTPFTILPIPLSAGQASASIVIPPNSGATVYSQVFAPGGGPFGWVFTNGVSTSLCPCVIPPAPTNLTATSIGVNSVTLSWIDNASNEVAYRVARLDPGEDPNNFEHWDNVSGSLPKNTTSFTADGLTFGNTYQFKVRAVNGCDEYSLYSAPIMVTAGCAKPATPSGLVVTGIGPDWVKVQWQDSANNEIAYRVSKLDPGEDPNNFDQWDNIGGDLPAGTTSFTFGGLTAEGMYSFRVRAKNPCGDYSDFSNIASSTTTCNIPPAPSGLVVIGAGVDYVTLAWVDQAPFETAYRVSKLDPGEDPNNFAQWDNVGGDLPANTTVFTIGGLVCETTYQFRVRCENACGEYSAFSNIVSGTTTSPTPPPAPYNVKAVGVGNTSAPDPVKITWSYSGPPVDGFRIARLDPNEPDTFANWDNIGGDLAPNVKEYTDTKNLKNGQTYLYKVRCFIVTPCGKVYSEYSNIDPAIP